MLSCAFPWNLLHTPSALAPRSDPILAIARENLGLTEGLGEISAFLAVPSAADRCPTHNPPPRRTFPLLAVPEASFPGTLARPRGPRFPVPVASPAPPLPRPRFPRIRLPTSRLPAAGPAQASASLRRHLPARPPALRLRGACRGAAAVPSLLPERPPRHRHRHRPAQRPRRRSLQVSGTGPGSGLGQGTAVPVCPPCPADSPRAAAPLPLQPGRSAAESAFLGAGEGQHRGQADGLAWSGLSLIIVSIRSSTKFRGVCASAPGAAS